MKSSVVWPIAGVLALGIVVFGVTQLPAQREREGFMNRPAPPQVGRFVVAHALAERVVVLDTVTGHLYVAGERDMKRMSELPRVGDGFPMNREQKKTVTEESKKTEPPPRKRSDDEQKETLKRPRPAEGEKKSGDESSR